jgi:thioredoxin-related protein
MNRTTVFAIIAIFIASVLIISAFKSGPSPTGEGWQTAINWSEPSVTGVEIIADGKPVYLFVSTEWCTFCRKMKGETFTDIRVQENLNKYFTNIHMNPETEGIARFTGKDHKFSELSRLLGVTGFPANFFFNEKGELIGGQPGYLSADQFADLTHYIGGGYYKNYKFSEFMSLSPDQKNQ